MLDPVALEDALAEERSHVLGRAGGEVLPELVADDVGTRPQQRHGERP